MKKCREISARLHALAQDEIDAAPAEDLMNHLSECRSCSGTFEEFKQMRSLLADNIASALACPDIAASVLTLASEPEETPPRAVFTVRRRRRHFAAAAVIVVLAIAGFFYWMGPFGPRRVVARTTHFSHSGGEWVPLEQDIRGMAELSTSAGERRSLRLENGVIVILNEKTTLEPRSTNQLNLLKGDIYVDTAGRRGLELSVKTEHAATHVTGTRFGVSTNKEMTTVVVEEGQVTVESEWGRQAVWAGYRYRITRTGRPIPPEPVDMDEAFPWIKERRRLAKMMAGALVNESEELQPAQSLAVDQELPATRVFGFIRDQGGEPVAGAELQAMAAGSGARISGSATATKSDGSYDLGGLQLNNPAPYKLVASAPGYGPALSEAFVFDKTPKEINITLPRCGFASTLPGLSEDAATALVDAVVGGDLERVQFLLAKGADIETRDENGETLLMVAAREAQSDIAEYLVEAGANVNATRVRHANWPSPLVYAARSGDVELVKLLLDKGADVHADAFRDLSPLGAAAASGNLQIVELLLEEDADINKADDNGRTILHAAIEGGNPKIVKLLLDNGAEVDPEIELPQGLVAPEAIHIAAERGTPELMGLLLDYGADIENPDPSGETPLSYAARAGNTEMVGFLLDKGAIIQRQDPERTTPLMCAAASGRINVIELFLSAGADINAQGRYGETPLYSAVFGYSREQEPYRPDTVRFLKAAGAREEYEGTFGMPELMWAVAENDLSRAKNLIEKDADVNEAGTRNETALSLAARLGLVEMTKLLLDAGTDVAPDESKGKNPLMAGIQRGSKNAYEVVRLLLDAGADPNAQNNYQSALIMAVHSDDAAILELLLSRGAVPNAQDYNGMTALAWAAGRGKTDMVRQLLDYGANPEIRRKPEHGGESILMDAIQQGHIDIVRLLIDHGTDVNYVSTYGRTALSNAISSGKTDFVKLLLENGADWRLDKQNPLVAAAGDGQTQILKLLLENGADPNAPASLNNVSIVFQYDRGTVLMAAVSGGHAAAAELLVAYGADVNARSELGKTALMIAADKGHASIVKLLVDNCAEINVKDNMGSTPLLLSVVYGRRDVIQFLQEIIGKEESEAQHYFTPLMWAAAKDDIETVKSLLESGVDVNEKEEFGGTALDGAILQGDTAMMKLLLDAGAEFDIRKGFGEVLMFQTVREDSVEVMRLLLEERNVDVNYSREGTTTLLMEAVRRGNEDMVKLLIEYGANVNARGQDGRTVLEVAERTRNKEVIKLLEDAGAEK